MLQHQELLVSHNKSGETMKKLSLLLAATCLLTACTAKETDAVAVTAEMQARDPALARIVALKGEIKELDDSMRGDRAEMERLQFINAADSHRIRIKLQGRETHLAQMRVQLKKMEAAYAQNKAQQEAASKAAAEQSAL